MEAAAAAGDVSFEGAASAAAALPPAATVAAAAAFTRLPIRFDSARAEVNALALLHLLDCGSGFDAQLLAKAGKGAAAGGRRRRLGGGWRRRAGCGGGRARHRRPPGAPPPPLQTRMRPRCLACWAC